MFRSKKRNILQLFSYTGVAQLVEQRSPKPQVVSSSLTTRAKLFK